MIRRARWAVLGAALAGISGCQTAPTAPAAETTADLILTNARVYTVEPGQPWAQSVAIRDGKILAVGSAADVARSKGANTRVVDLGGKLLMPAFGDAHVHPVFGGMSYSRCSLHKGQTVEDYQKIVAGCIAATPGNGVIYGVGWGHAMFPPSGAPRKEVLDQVSRDRPLIFLSGDGHGIWLNSKALQVAKITKATRDPANGKIDRDPKTGEPSGSLQEAAKDLVKDLVPPPSAAEMQNSIAYTSKYFNSLGITSLHDAGIEYEADGSSAVLDAYRAVRDRGDLTSHVAIDWKWKNERPVDQLPGLLRAAERARSYGIAANSVKFYLDGVIPGHTAAMIDPYEHSHEHGKSQISPAALLQAVSDIDARGMQAHVHAIGDRGVREALDAFAEARRRNGPKDNRHMISHLNVVDPADQPRFGQLGAVAIFQPTWASEYPYMRLTAKAIGDKRMGYIYPAGSILKAGGKLAYGADWPVATANPLEGLQIAVTRTSIDDPKTGPLLAGEGITLVQAVEAHTLNVAYVNHLDKVTGSIAVGKSADVIVLDRDIFQIPVLEISKSKVLVTLFKGREVFGKMQ